MVNKRIVIIATLIAIIVVAGIVYFSIERELKKQYTERRHYYDKRVVLSSNFKIYYRSIPYRFASICTGRHVDLLERLAFYGSSFCPDVFRRNCDDD